MEIVINANQDFVLKKGSKLTDTMGTTVSGEVILDPLEMFFLIDEDRLAHSSSASSFSASEPQKEVIKKGNKKSILRVVVAKILKDVANDYNLFMSVPNLYCFLRRMGYVIRLKGYDTWFPTAAIEAQRSMICWYTFTPIVPTQQIKKIRKDVKPIENLNTDTADGRFHICNISKQSQVIAGRKKADQTLPDAFIFIQKQKDINLFSTVNCIKKLFKQSLVEKEQKDNTQSRLDRCNILIGLNEGTKIQLISCGILSINGPVKTFSLN